MITSIFGSFSTKINKKYLLHSKLDDSQDFLEKITYLCFPKHTLTPSRLSTIREQPLPNEYKRSDNDDVDVEVKGEKRLSSMYVSTK